MFRLVQWQCTARRLFQDSAERSVRLCPFPPGWDSGAVPARIVQIVANPRATSRRRGPAARPRSARRCSGDARCRRPRPSTATTGRPCRGRRTWGVSRCSRSASSSAGRTSCSWATSAPARRTWRRPSARWRARGGSRRASSRRPRSGCA